MRLEKVIIQGFKSFYFKTEISIYPGLTVVVGPNGSGKSNIADAIAWVMGEQSSKALRSDEMQQVISQGSKMLKALGMAEVSLLFKENNDNYTTVTRKLFRSGESSYIINGEEVRLKDVLDMLSSFHLAPKSYTIIEQNRIQTILDSRPAERRIFFDDAAGITRYKSKKKETLNKLLDAEKNLQRINDIIAEVSKNRKSIKRQALKALNYNRLSSLLFNLKGTLYSIKFTSIKKEIEKLSAEIDSIIKEKNDLIQKIISNNADAENTKQLILQKEETITNLSNQISLLEAKIRDIEKQIAVNQTNLTNINNDLQSKQELLEEYIQKQVKIQNHLKALGNNILMLDGYEKEINRFKSHILAYNNVLDKIITTLQNRKEQEKQIYYRMKSDYETRLSYKTKLEDSTKELNSNLNHFVSTLAKIQAAIKNQRIIYESCDELLQMLHKYYALIENLKQKMISCLSSLDNNLNEYKNSENNIKAELNKNKLLCCQVEKFLNEQFSFRAIQNFLPEISNLSISFRGFLIDKIEIPDEFKKLVSFIFRDTLYAAIVETPEDMKILDKYLFDKNVTYSIICLSSLKNNNEKEISTNNAISLSEFLSINGDMNILLDIFADVYIFDDMNAFIKATVNNNSYLYFREQQLLYYKGCFYHLKNLIDKNNALLYEYEIKKLKKDDLILNMKLSDTYEKIKLAEKYKFKIKDDYEHISQLISKVSEIGINIEKISSQTNILKKELELKIQITSGDQLSANNKINKNKEEINQINYELINYERGLKEKENLINLLETYISSYKKIINHYKIIDDKIKYNSLKLSGVIHSLTNDKTRIIKEGKELNFTIDKFKNIIAESKRIVDKMGREQRGLDNQIKKLVEEKKSTSEIYYRITTEKNELKAKVGALETLLKKFMQDKESITTRLNELNIKKAQLEIECSHLSEICINEARKDVQIIENIDNYSMNQIQLDIDKIEKKLNQLGPINSLAVGEYEEINKKYEFLKEQHSDITQSISMLRKAVEKLDLYMKQKLIEAMDCVNKYLNEYFQLIFKNGNIGIYFEDNENILESPIEFRIKIPTKKVSSFQLLSGGEKALIALLFLFSIFRYRPSFFCVWDEIDAALDDTNINSIINILNQLKQQVQFVLISHSKLMMEAADQLYGVTMEDEGVSKIYSVKISELKEENIAV